MPGAKRVIVESPYAGDVEENLRYLRACLRDSIMRHEAPFASHAIYTQDGVLDDKIPRERMMGIECGFAWRECAELTVFYIDRGWSKGMLLAREHCVLSKSPFETRMLEQKESRDGQ